MKTYVNKRTGYLQTVVGGRVNGIHRFVMEQSIGRKLSFNEVVHHKNGDKTDNRLENLEVLSRAEHTRMHSRVQWVKIVCSACKNDFERRPSYINKGKKAGVKIFFCSRACIGKMIHEGKKS
jgi:hypothetical protein